MKSFFCKIFLIVGLGLGFSVHSQESDWVTCKSSEGCSEHHRDYIKNIVDEGDHFTILLGGFSDVTCLKSDFSEGMKCLEIKRQQNRNRNNNQ